MSKSRHKFYCKDCHEDTGHMKEHYFINTELCLSVMPDITGMLCIGCLETRLWRIFTPNDFTEATINSPKYENKSIRLINRLGI